MQSEENTENILEELDEILNGLKSTDFEFDKGLKSLEEAIEKHRIFHKAYSKTDLSVKRLDWKQGKKEARQFDWETLYHQNTSGK